MQKALMVIDIRNDYFPGGNYPLWNAEATLENIEKAIKSAQIKEIPIILVQHIADPEKGISPFFNKGSAGVALHPRLVELVPEAPVIIKKFADGFVETDLVETLSQLGVTDLLVCGMMTQNCVTHTAISKSAAKYTVTVLSDCCTSVDEMIHKIALNALTTRLPIVSADVVIGAE